MTFFTLPGCTAKTTNTVSRMAQHGSARWPCCDYLTQNEQLRLLNKIGPIRSTELLDLMKSDDLALLLTDLPEKDVEKLIAEMRAEGKRDIRLKMKFPKKVAGRAMINQYVWVHESYTVEKAIDKLKHFKDYADYLNYVYVIDDQKRIGWRRFIS